MKQLFLLALFWAAVILPFSHAYADASQQENSLPHPTTSKPKKLHINIITKPSKVGISSDVQILKKALTKLGHASCWINIIKPFHIQYADVNIFIEGYDDSLFPYAEKNYFFPNPEWCSKDADIISSFDLILCKTREAERIFKNYNANSIFTSFSSEDRFDPNTTKNYHKALHLAGKSIQKGTSSVLKTWTNNPQFPKLFVINNRKMGINAKRGNLDFIHDFLSKSKLQTLQNECGLHICPSETEGFGHYIMEALSCSAVVVTTNAPPMNEFITDNRCLVGYKSTQQQSLATNYYVDELQLANVVDSLLKLPESELIEIGKKNRQFYLENDRFFNDSLANIFPKAYGIPHKNMEK